MMEYKVLAATGISDFMLLIEEYIEFGWVPQGGIVVIAEPSMPKFYQAMVKNEHARRLE